MSLLYWSGFGLLLITWLAASRWLVPAIIDAAYHGRSLGFLNDMIVGQEIRSLDGYLAIWRRISRLATGGLAIAGGALYGILQFRRRLVDTGARGYRWITSIPVRPREFLHIAAWLGAITGLVEGVFLEIRWAVSDLPWRSHSIDAVWTSPATTAVLFFLGALLLLLLLGRFRAASQGTAVFVFSGLATYALLHIFKLKMYDAAILVLALGVAVQLTRATTSRQASLKRLIRLSTPWLVVLPVAFGFGLRAKERILERSALKQLALPAEGAPNILLLILDTVRASSLSLYGYDRPTTPQLDRLARAGVTFDMAIAPSPWTLPSHASVFTGREPHELSADWMARLNGSFPTLAEILASVGYETVGFVGNQFYASATSGLGRGFIRYEDRPTSFGWFVQNSWLTKTIVEKTLRRLGVHHSLSRKTAASVTDEFTRWLDTRADRPFFAFLNYFDAHDPYRPPQSFKLPFGSPDGRYWTSWTADYAEGETQELIDAYDSSINYVDSQIGLLLEELAGRGLRENTIIIVTSDHGEQFGEHHPRLFNHGNSLYLPLLRVPLVIAYSGRVPSGGRVSRPVSLRNLPATIMHLIGADTAGAFPGETLARYWIDSTSRSGRPVLSELNPNTPWNRARPFAASFEPIQRGPMKSLIQDSWHYIRNGDGQEELYDIAADPWEQIDLSQSGLGRRALLSFRQCLAEMLDGDGMDDTTANPRSSCAQVVAPDRATPGITP